MSSFSVVSISLILCLLIAQLVWSQSYDDLCVMFDIWDVNGLYSFEDEWRDDKKVYHRQSTPEDGCTDDVYLFWDSSWQEWTLGHNHTDAGYNFYAYCWTQDPTQCDGDWSDAGNNRVSPSQVVADACPEWDCDYVNIPDAPDLYCREFDVKLDDEGSNVSTPNVWYSTANEQYWYFSFVFMEWVCSPRFTSVYACVGVGTWTENYAWVDVERGQTRNIDFEDWIWSDEQNDWVYDGRVSAAVECGEIATTTSTTTTSTSRTDAILSTSSTRSTESDTDGHNGENESTSTDVPNAADTGGNGQNSSKSSSGGATVALATVLGLVVVCVAVALLFMCYRSWRTQQKEIEGNIAAQGPPAQVCPGSAPLGTVPSNTAREESPCGWPQLQLATAGEAEISPGAAAPVHATKHVRVSTNVGAEGTGGTGAAPPPAAVVPAVASRQSVANACQAAENDDEIVGDDEAAEVGTPQYPPPAMLSASTSEATMAELRERAKSQQDLKNDAYERVLEWLVNEVELPQYFDVLVKNGYDSMAIIAKTIDSVDALAEIGITAKGHQKAIMMEIEKLFTEGS